MADIPKDVPVHLELASMTDKDYMNSILQEVCVVSQVNTLTECCCLIQLCVAASC